jgi:hypothetical protein
VCLGQVFVQGSPSLIQRAREILISVSGTGPVRFGDASVSASQGLQIPVTVQPVILRTTVGDRVDSFNLLTVFVFIPGSTTCSIVVGV